ncbi:hypothetical protein P9112_001609 [Eukaryota sp. TZLM1-RC]
MHTASSELIADAHYKFSSLYTCFNQWIAHHDSLQDRLSLLHNIAQRLIHRCSLASKHHYFYPWYTATLSKSRSRRLSRLRRKSLLRRALSDWRSIVPHLKVDRLHREASQLMYRQRYLSWIKYWQYVTIYRRRLATSARVVINKRLIKQEFHAFVKWKMACYKVNKKRELNNNSYFFLRNNLFRKYFKFWVASVILVQNLDDFLEYWTEKSSIFLKRKVFSIWIDHFNLVMESRQHYSRQIMKRSLSKFQGVMSAKREEKAFLINKFNLLKKRTFFNELGSFCVARRRIFTLECKAKVQFRQYILKLYFQKLILNQNQVKYIRDQKSEARKLFRTCLRKKAFKYLILASDRDKPLLSKQPMINAREQQRPKVQKHEETAQKMAEKRHDTCQRVGARIPKYLAGRIG